MAVATPLLCPQHSKTCFVNGSLWLITLAVYLCCCKGPSREGFSALEASTAASLLQVMFRHSSPEAEKHSCNHILCSLLNPLCQSHKIALPGQCEAAPPARQSPCGPAAEAAGSALLPDPRQAAAAPACAAHARPLQRLQMAQGCLQEEQTIALDLRLRLFTIQNPCEQVSMCNTHKTSSAGSKAGGDLQRLQKGALILALAALRAQGCSRASAAQCRSAAVVLPNLVEVSGSACSC